MRKNQGFTLLEVLVAATIIAVLSIIGVVSYSSVNKRSRDTKRKSDLEQVRIALEMYRADNITAPGEYPGLGAGSSVNASGLSASLVSTYMPAIPDDSDTDTNYWYQALPAGGPYTSYCLCGKLETLTVAQSTCSTALNATNCNYGLKNP